MSMRVRVDPTNPGQYFACCGLLELADRLWPGAEGWFVGGHFDIDAHTPEATLAALWRALQQAGVSGALTPALQMERDALEEKQRRFKKQRTTLTHGEEVRRKHLGALYRQGNLRLGEPFDLLLDWWQDDVGTPKTWAGSQAVTRIARAALAATIRVNPTEACFDVSCVMQAVQDDEDESDAVEDEESAGGQKVEPFYFDARRGMNAQAVDVGFVPDAIQMLTAAYPVVEFMCLVGLQRCRPVPTDTPRTFDYWTWPIPLRVAVLPAAVCGLLGLPRSNGYRFENAFRTSQKKHKSFLPATPIRGDT